MINIFQFEKKIKEQIDKDRENDKKQKWLNNYNDQREEMITKYKKRIMQFIDKVAKKSHEKGDDYSKRLDIAEKSYFKSKILGDESIRIQHKFETSRIKENEDKNKSLLDTVPNEILDSGDPLKLRQRDKIKEIVPPYRQKAHGSMERLYDSILIDKGLSNNMRTDRIAPRSFHRKLQQHKEDPRTFMNKTNGNHLLTPRKFLPELHDKTHFKAAYTIMLNSQSCLQDKYGKTLFVKQQEEIQQNRIKHDKSQNISLSRFNKSISQRHGLNRNSSLQQLKQQQSSFGIMNDMSLNDRIIEQQNHSPSSQDSSFKRNDQSLINLINEISTGVDQKYEQDFNQISRNQQEIYIQTPNKFPGLKKVQSQLNFQKTINMFNTDRKQQQQPFKSDNDQSDLDYLLHSYRSKQQEPDQYLAWEYDEEGRKIQKDVIGIKKKHKFGELLDPTEEEKHRSEFLRIQNKTKDMIANCSYVRKKHFKAHTLRLGEGSLFINKGISNKEYENSILKKSLQ